jgi:hypothetical protein
MPLPTLPARRLASPSLFALALAATACGEYPTMPPIEQVLASDTVAPTVSVQAASSLLVGDSVRLSVSDSVGLKRAGAVLVLRDGNTATVVWSSEPVTFGRSPRVTSASPSIRLNGFDETFRFGETLQLVGWAEDLAGNMRYAGAPDDDSGSLSAASGVAVSLSASAYLGLPAGHKFGAIAFDPSTHTAYFTNTTGNEVGAISTRTLSLSHWRIRVGSAPTHIAHHAYGWGAAGTLVVANSGGSDLSVIDLTRAEGGAERMRITIPLVRAILGSDTVRLSPTASSFVMHCANTACMSPTLYLASPSAFGTGTVVTRTVAITAVDPLARFDILTPDFSPVLPKDSAIAVSAFATFPETNTDSLIFSRTDVSLCGTLAFGSTRVAAPRTPGGPMYIAETGIGGVCGSSGRILRFDMKDGRYTHSALPIAYQNADPRLRGAIGVSTNDDASLVALKMPDRVLITDGHLRILGTLFVPSAHEVSFLSGQRGGPAALRDGGLVAVSAADGVHIFELQNYRKAAVIKLHVPIASSLIFAPMGEGDRLAVLGLSAAADRVVTATTSLSALLRLASQ